jgi:hypothetical protein
VIQILFGASLWQSPATRIVKRRAVQKGLDLPQFTQVMQGYHTVDNLAGLAARSVFVVGDRDPFVPMARKNALLAGIEKHGHGANVVKISAGHVRTLIASGRHQRAMLGISQTPRTWVSLAWPAQARRAIPGMAPEAHDGPAPLLAQAPQSALPPKS